MIADSMLQEYAKVGARIRWQEISAEQNQLLAMFPDLGGVPPEVVSDLGEPLAVTRKKKRGRPRKVEKVQEAPEKQELQQLMAETAPSTMKKTVSAAAKRKLSTSMKKYWAKRRAQPQ